MQTITVDMTPGFRQPTIHYSQNDVGTTFAIDLRSRFGDTLPASPTVKIQATKPSGFGFSIEADSVVDSVATFTTVATMTDEAGRFPAELEVSDSGMVLYTANFYMEGEANPHPEGTIDGSQETIIPTLTLLVERVEAAASSVLDMTVEAETLAAGSQATYSYDEDTNTATFGIPQGEAGAGAAGVTASAYSASKTYAVGDYVIHNSNLYRCTTAITTAEAFTAAHWTQVVLGDDVCDLKADLNETATDLKSASNNIYNNLFYNSGLSLNVGSWEHGIIDANGDDYGNAQNGWGRTTNYYVPLTNLAVTIKNIGATARTIVCAFNSSNVMTARNVYYDAVTQITLSAGTKYKFCVVTDETSIDLNHMDEVLLLLGTTLHKRIGVDELKDNIANHFVELNDSFGASSRFVSSGITYSKSDNSVSWECTSDSAYILYNAVCQASHKYALYYEASGTLTGGNYEFDARLHTGGGAGWAGSAFLSVSQTSGADISGTSIFTVPSGSDVYLGFDFVNKNGQEIDADFYLYDVTALSDDDIYNIDFSTVGVSNTVIIGIGGSGSAPESWVGKKVVFYGDSITAQNKYPVMVQNVYGFAMVNASVGGARISYRGSGDTDMSADSRLNALPSDADVVVIMGGTNDWGKVQIEQTLAYNNGFDRTKFKGGLAYIIKKIQAQCPSARLIVATLIGGRNETRAGATPTPQYLPEADQYGQTDLDFRNAEIEVAELLNIEVCDTWSCGINGNNSDTMIADTVHPTNAGAKLIADYIIGYFKAVYIG